MPKTLLSITSITALPAGSSEAGGRRARFITLPASKSISNRLLIMQALSGNEITIDNQSTADDTNLLVGALATTTGEIHLGNAGTALRFATAWAAITPGERILTGTERLCNRPLKPLIDCLRQCGADITCLEREGYAPIRIRGKQLNGTTLHIDGSESSQFLTAMLLVAPYFEGTTRFSLDPAQVSLPYIQMTATLMERGGADIRTEADSITITPGAYTEASFTVEPDWSAASYFYLFALFRPDISIILEGLTAKSVQGDKVTRTLFASLGIYTEFTNRGARLENRNVSTDGLQTFSPDQPLAAADKQETRFVDTAAIDCLTFPDLAQTLATAACGLNTSMRLNGLQTLRLKETDRITALATELQKCGTPCTAGADYLEIHPFQPARHRALSDTPEIATYSDHRMAMAFAPLAAVFGEIIIENPDVVTKSFPNFWQEVKKLGFTLSEFQG